MSIINNLKQNLKEHGYIGDTRPPILVYLSLVSALLDQPVSLVLKGSSGCGKSFALAAGKRYVPEEAYEEFSAMSEKALAYMGGSVDLKNKTLIIQEASGMAQGEGRLFLRQLLTEGELKYVTVQQTQNGFESKQNPTLEGPCGLLMTTTANGLHQEDENRMLSIHMDEDPSLIREKLLAKSMDLVSKPSKEELEYFHGHYWAVKEGSRKASIPFADGIVEQTPTSHLRIIRDMDKVFSLIKTNALLHANERDTSSDGTVIANLEDYNIVRDLVEGVLAQGLGAAVPENIRSLIRVVSEMTKRDSDSYHSGWKASVNQREIAEQLKIDPSVVSRNLEKAIAEGFLENDNPGQGRPSAITLGSRELPSGQILPDLN